MIDPSDVLSASGVLGKLGMFMGGAFAPVVGLLAVIGIPESYFVGLVAFLAWVITFVLASMLAKDAKVPPTTSTESSDTLLTQESAEVLSETSLKIDSAITRLVELARQADKHRSIHTTLIKDLIKALPMSFIVIDDTDKGNVLLMSTEAAVQGASDLNEDRPVEDWVSLWTLYKPDGTEMGWEDWPVTRLRGGETIDRADAVVVKSVQESDGVGGFYALWGHPLRDSGGTQIGTLLYFQEISEGEL